MLTPAANALSFPIGSEESVRPTHDERASVEPTINVSKHNLVDRDIDIALRGWLTKLGHEPFI
jgi:hypothetical protein